MNQLPDENLAALIHEIVQAVGNAQSNIQKTVNHAMVICYWDIGRLIVEHEQNGASRSAYGKKQLTLLSEQLTSIIGKGFGVRNLRNMRMFYQTFPIRHALRTELSWTHYRSLIRVENTNAREWYVNESIQQNWSARALERQISVLYYERLLSSKEHPDVKKEAEEKTTLLKDNNQGYLRDPYVLDFLNLDGKRYLETQVEQGIIDNLQQFLLELGKGFAFVERQQRVSLDDQDFYLDLVFYNFKLKCFLLVDLKVGKLTHQDIGQMDTYVRMYDQHKKGSDDNPTIGLILCSKKSEAIAKYSVLSDSQQLFASKYLPNLPSIEELQKEIERERNLVLMQLEQDESDAEGK